MAASASGLGIWNFAPLYSTYSAGLDSSLRMQPSHGHGDHTQYEGQAEATAGVGSQMFQAASQTSGRTTPRRQILTLEEPADRAASIAARNLSPLVSPSSIGMYSSCLPGASQLKSACAWLTQPLGSAQIPWSVYSSQ